MEKLLLEYVISTYKIHEAKRFHAKHFLSINKTYCTQVLKIQDAQKQSMFLPWTQDLGQWRLVGNRDGWRLSCKTLRETRKSLRGKPIFSEYFFLIVEKLWVQFILLNFYLANQHLFQHNIFLTSLVGKTIQNSHIKIKIIFICSG